MAASSSSSASLVISAGNSRSNGRLHPRADQNNYLTWPKSGRCCINRNSHLVAQKLHVTPITQYTRRTSSSCHVMPISASCELPPSDQNNNKSSNNNSNDNAGGQEYVECSIFEAVEVKSGSDGFLIKKRDGSYVRCAHNSPGRLPDYAPQPAIVLKIEDGSDILLPIIVLEMPATMLMETIRNVHMTRPTIYQVLKDLVEVIGYKAKLVRVTKRVHEAYYAQLFLSKDGDEFEEVVLDLRPSDAINVAARCKIPIQVNKELAYCDGVRLLNDPVKTQSSQRPKNFSTKTTLLTELDRPQTTTTKESEEFVLVWNMLMAAAEERYIDAARIRDELKELRSKERI